MQPMVEDNSHAGQGAVALNIGGDVGALIVLMPDAMAGAEVEIRPEGLTPEPAARQPHAHTHDLEHDHDQPHVHYPHVAVVGRPIGDRIVFSLVYPELLAGRYELHVMPEGPVQLSATVVGGEVAEVVWPTD
jgi:hypothetical protein